jgi:hypothetical protein
LKTEYDQNSSIELKIIADELLKLRSFVPQEKIRLSDGIINQNIIENNVNSNIDTNYIEQSLQYSEFLNNFLRFYPYSAILASSSYGLSVDGSLLSPSLSLATETPLDMNRTTLNGYQLHCEDIVSASSTADTSIESSESNSKIRNNSQESLLSHEQGVEENTTTQDVSIQNYTNFLLPVLNSPFYLGPFSYDYRGLLCNEYQDLSMSSTSTVRSLLHESANININNNKGRGAYKCKLCGKPKVFLLYYISSFFFFVNSEYLAVRA